MTIEQNLNVVDSVNTDTEKETRKSTKKKRNQKIIHTVVTSEIRKKVADSLREMYEEIRQQKEQKPAEILIRENLKIIDDMTKKGATLTQIYERINKIFALNINAASFGVYVRKIRKEMGSEISQKQTPKNSVCEQTSEKVTNNNFVCEHCQSESIRTESKHQPGKFFWRCAKCGTFYQDCQGELTSEILKVNAQ